MNRASLLVFSVLSILLIAPISNAFAAQLSWDAKTPESAEVPHFKFQRTAYIEYKEGGAIADALRGQSKTIEFTVDSTAPGVDVLIEKLNENLQQLQSSARVTDITVEYQASLNGRGDNASVDFRVILTPKIDEIGRAHV